VTASQATEEVFAPPPTEPGRLHRPGRAFIALAELLVAGGLVVLAFWAWPQGFETIVSIARDGREVSATRTYGNWLAAAVGFGAVAALLLVDATRQVALAVRARPKRVKRSTKVARDD
jgi:hypothetical protein